VGAIGGCTVTILDLETMKPVRRRCLPMGTVDVAYDAAGGRVILPLTFQGEMAVLDFDTLRTEAAVPLGPGIRPVCYVPDRDLIVVGNYLSGDLHFIDGKSYRVLKTIWGGTRIRDIQYAPLRQRLYVCASLYVLEIDLDALLGIP
jgi:DNA-binding beta-propeller fold protein YncE